MSVFFNSKIFYVEVSAFAKNKTTVGVVKNILSVNCNFVKYLIKTTQLQFDYDLECEKIKINSYRFLQMNSAYTLTGHFIKYTWLVPGWTFRTALILHGIDSTRC